MYITAKRLNATYASAIITGLEKLGLMICFLLLSIAAVAQGPGGGFNNEKIEAAKVAFLTQKLDLSAEEAKIFWPIYNDYQREQDALRKAHMERMISFRKVKEINDMTDTEIQTLIYNDFDFRQRDLNIERKYYSKLKANLPIKIIGKFYRAQEAFKRELLNQFRGGNFSKRQN